MWTNVKVTGEQRLRIDRVRGQVPVARWVSDAIEARLAVKTGGPGSPSSFGIDGKEFAAPIREAPGDGPTHTATVRRKVDRGVAPVELPKIAKRS